MNISAPRVLLHGEGATLLLASIYVFAVTGGNWLLFLVLLFVPDIAAIGYLAGVRIGSFSYNAVHTTPVPALLILAGYFTHQPLMIQIGCIWLAHIGMDRFFGFGLKYATTFQDTHLQHV